MANKPIYDGNPIFTPGVTPFGFYDNDIDFQNDAIKVTKFCASRLGYPIMDVELTSGSFFTAFESAVTVYGNELYAYLIRDNQLSAEGNTQDNPLNEVLFSPSFEPIIRLGEQFGQEAGVGGNINTELGMIPLTASIQDYDVKQWALDNGIISPTSSFDIEITRVFYEAPPAILRFFDPFVGSGFGNQNMYNSFGFGSFSPALNFHRMPLSYDMQTIQAIEMNDQIRRTNYSFELRNNKIKIFPIPWNDNGSLNFEYIKREDRTKSSIQQADGKITNISNIPYTNPNYSKINSVGRMWVFEYTVALVKEMLGLVRGKYTNIPIPNEAVTLNQSDLLSQASLEKEKLIENLRKYLDETSRKSLLERRRDENNFRDEELKRVPYTIYVG